MDNALRRKDTTKGPPLRILSLDGGGVRGYSMLIIIQELMHRTYVELKGKAPRRDQIPKPCDHFDLICGTGTGGLIAIMLGRLRLDLETCKEVYVAMTRKVFLTDKTIAGIPYRSTLFKASKLEEAIKECVREHTTRDEEGDDGESLDLHSPLKPQSEMPQRHASNASVASFSTRNPSAYTNKPLPYAGWGNAEARLYDTREHRTKTAVTAIYKGTRPGGLPAMLRSYDSRRETAPESDCTIWQAGRATCATGLAFKPIQVGHSVFIDEGNGQYNPSPFVLDEACVNEWPGRDVGVFISIGTGKRPSGSDHNQHLWYEDFMGEFAEARRRLVAKIEGCEKTHQQMLKDFLPKRGVNPDNYYRINVEVGVGEFGMNEWNRLADISTNTRQYLGRSDVQRLNVDAAAKLARILRAKWRQEGNPEAVGKQALSNVPEVYPYAIELPADVPEPQYLPPPPPSKDANRDSYDAGVHDVLPIRTSTNTYHIPDPTSYTSPRSSTDSRRQYTPPTSSGSGSHQHDDDKFVVSAPTPSQYRTATGSDLIAITTLDEYPRFREPSASRVSEIKLEAPLPPPPIPPKTPIEAGEVNDARWERGNTAQQHVRIGSGEVRRPVVPLPYPDDDGPPPIVNLARKPDYRGR